MVFLKYVFNLFIAENVLSAVAVVGGTVTSILNNECSSLNVFLFVSDWHIVSHIVRMLVTFVTLGRVDRMRLGNIAS